MFPLEAFADIPPAPFKAVVCALSLQERGILPTPEAIASVMGIKKSVALQYLQAAVKTGWVRYDRLSISIVWEKEKGKFKGKNFLPKEIVFYHSLVKRYPPKAEWENIIEGLQDISFDDAAECYRRWLAEGYSPYNWGWIERLKNEYIKPRSIFKGIEEE